MRTSRIRLAALLTAAGIVATACSSSAKPAGNAPNVSPASNSGAVLGVRSTSLGKILVNGKGMTVYGFALDKPGTSNCTGSCAHYWPPVPAPAAMPGSVSGISGTIGEITRSDGSKQLTVDNLPVYTYIGDSKPGATTGQGLNLSGGLWWVVGTNGKWITTKPGGPSSSSNNGGYVGGY